MHPVFQRLTRTWVLLRGREMALLRHGAVSRRKGHISPVLTSQSSCVSQRGPGVEVAQAGASSRPQCHATAPCPGHPAAANCAQGCPQQHSLFSSGHVGPWWGRGGGLLPASAFPALGILGSCAKWQPCNSMRQPVRMIWGLLDCTNLI